MNDQQRASHIPNEAQLWTQSLPFIAHHTDQMMRGFDSSQRIFEAVNPQGSQMTFQYHVDSDIADYVPCSEKMVYEPAPPVYQQDPVPGRAVLQGYEAPNERLFYLFRDLSKRAIRAAHDEIYALPRKYQPPEFDLNTVLHAPPALLQQGNNLSLLRSFLLNGNAKPTPGNRQPRRRVVELDSPLAPLPARERPKNYDNKFVAAQQVLELPPPPPLKRNHGFDDDKFEDSPLVEDPGNEDQINQDELPFTLSLAGVKNLEKNEKWPVPTVAPRNDLGYSYLLLNKILSKLRELKTRVPYRIEDFERVCSRSQMERLKRWIHLPGTQWKTKENIELFELVKEHGTSAEGWMKIGAEMRMFYSVEAYNRYQQLRGYDAYFQKNWTAQEDKLLFYLLRNPRVRQGMYEVFVRKYPLRTRRSCLRRLEKLYFASIGQATLDPSDSKSSIRYRGPLSFSASHRSARIEGGKRKERSRENVNDSRSAPSFVRPAKKQRSDKNLLTSPERVRLAFNKTTQQKPIHLQREPSRKITTQKRLEPQNEIPFSKDKLNLLWELRKWEYPNDTLDDWNNIAHELNVKREGAGAFVRNWYVLLDMDNTSDYPLTWTEAEDEILKRLCQERPRKWKSIASKLPRHSPGGCQRRMYALDKLMKSPTDSGL